MMDSCSAGVRNGPGGAGLVFWNRDTFAFKGLGRFSKGWMGPGFIGLGFSKNKNWILLVWFQSLAHYAGLVFQKVQDIGCRVCMGFQRVWFYFLVAAAASSLLYKVTSQKADKK